MSSHFSEPIRLPSSSDPTRAGRGLLPDRPLLPLLSTCVHFPPFYSPEVPSLLTGSQPKTQKWSESEIKSFLLLLLFTARCLVNTGSTLVPNISSVVNETSFSKTPTLLKTTETFGDSIYSVECVDDVRFRIRVCVKFF